MKQKYDLHHAGRGFLISPIEEKTVRFTERIMSCKPLRKMQPIEYTAKIVELTEQCTAGVIFNWSQDLLNELIEDAEQV